LINEPKERTQTVLENKLLRGSFGPEGEEEARGWSERQNEKLQNL
jgi:hypothetical protein